MNRRNFSNLGDEIKDIVQNAVNTMNFQQLNRDIENTVNGALNEVRNALGADRGRQNRDFNRNNRQRNRSYKNYGPPPGQTASGEQAYNRGRPPHTNPNFMNQDQSATRPQTKPDKGCFPKVPVGRVTGILLTIFGNIGIGTSGIAVFVLALIGQLTGKLDFFGTIALALLPVFFISLFLAAKGSRIRKRMRRFRRYLEIFQNRSYYPIKELSFDTGFSPKFILKDLRKMISLGMFPEGRIDEQGTCLMLNRESYQQYLELQKNIRMRNLEEQERNKAAANQANGQETSRNPAGDKTMDTELRKAVESGYACIQQIREANDAIPGEEISRKLDRLEEVIGKIFQYVEVHPAQLPEIQKFMNYYLPTTLKLVNAYREFDYQSVQGENITAAKNEIEATLDTINLAFEKLLDSLFEDAAMDVSTDISVLETLLAQEGLTNKDFKKN